MEEGEQTETVETESQPVHEIMHPSQADFSKPPVEATPQEEVTTSSPEPEKVELTTDGKEKGPEDKTVQAEATPSSPLTKEEAETLTKRLQDNADWTNRVNQENAQLKQVLAQQSMFMEKVSKQMDGTWTDEDEQRLSAQVAPQQQDPQITLENVNFEGRRVASLAAAEEKYGKEYLDKVVNTPDFANFINAPGLKEAIKNDPTPVIRAVEMYKWVKIQEKYGRTPDAFVAGVEKELEPKLRAKIEKELRTSLKLKGELPQGIGSVSTDNLPPPTTAWGPEQQMQHLQKTRAGSFSG